MTVAQSSLLDPSGARPLERAASWLTGLLTGGLVVTLCVIAVAFVGFLLLTGRFDIRRAGLVALGCFVLLGAPIIASAFLTITTSVSQTAPPPPAPIVAVEDVRGDLPPAEYDPYAGASMRRD